ITESKKRFSSLFAKNLTERRKIEIDQAGLRKNRPNRTDTTSDPIIRFLNSGQNTCRLLELLEQNIVRQRNHSIAGLSQCHQSFFCLFLTANSFESERQSDK